MIPVQKRILLIGSKASICDRAFKHAHDIMLIQKPELYDPAINHLCTAVLLIDYEDAEELVPLVVAAHQRKSFDAVLSLTEYGLIPAAKIAAMLGLPATPVSVVERTRDKFLMRQCLAEAQFSKIASGLGRTLEDIRLFADRNGYPIIVKPRNLSSSRGVVKLSNHQELSNFQPQGESFLIEEYLDGRELSVETLSFSGKHIIIAINEETKNQFGPNEHVEIAHQIPAVLDEETHKKVHEFIEEFLSIIGITDGPCHTEVKLTSKGLKVIETHNRIAGDNIAELVQLATGVDMIATTLCWILYRSAPLRQAPQAFQGAAIRYFTPRPGIVKHVHGADAWRSAPGVWKIHLPLKPGDLIRPVMESDDRAGFVIATGKTSTEAAELCKLVCDSISIEMSGN